MYTIQTTKPMSHPCGFCNSHNHEYCPGTIVNGDETTALRCSCVECTPPLRCVNCNSRTEVNPELHICEDRDQCAARIEQSRKEAHEKLWKGRTPTRIPGASPSARKTSRKNAPARVGKCLCCGKPTKGGRFLPGHDSKYLSTVVDAVREKGASVDGIAGLMADEGCPETLIAKFKRKFDTK